jgi:nucleoside-diphosphate kinase
MANEPFPGLARWQSHKIVSAGEITEIVPAGCYVKTETGGGVLLMYPSGPSLPDRFASINVGDYWVIYEDNYQSISPKKAFEKGYKPFEAANPRTDYTFAMIKSHIFDHREWSEAKWQSEAKFGAIVSEIFKANLVIEKMVRTALTANEIQALYAEHIDKPYWDSLRESVQGIVVPMVLSGSNVTKRWRDVLGATNPATADPYSLRGRFGNHRVMANNVAHGSDSPESAKREIELMFPDFAKQIGL